MRCHQHLDFEAVAVCVSCGRGLCRDCQQPTLDQRLLCGMPQCAQFAKRQAAVHFAVRQSCSNQATGAQMLGELLRTMSLVLMIPSVLFLLGTVLVIGGGIFGWMIRGQPLTPAGSWFSLSAPVVNVLLIAAVGIMLALITAQVLRFQSRMTLLQKNWEDLAGEFRGGDSGD